MREIKAKRIAELALKSKENQLRFPSRIEERFPIRTSKCLFSYLDLITRRVAKRRSLVSIKGDTVAIELYMKSIKLIQSAALISILI